MKHLKKFESKAMDRLAKFLSLPSKIYFNDDNDIVAGILKVIDEVTIYASDDSSVSLDYYFIIDGFTITARLRYGEDAKYSPGTPERIYEIFIDEAKLDVGYYQSKKFFDIISNKSVKFDGFNPPQVGLPSDLPDGYTKKDARIHFS